MIADAAMRYSNMKAEQARAKAEGRPWTPPAPPISQEQMLEMVRKAKENDKG